MGLCAQSQATLPHICVIFVHAAFFSTLKVEAAGFCETQVPVYQTTWCHTQKTLIIFVTISSIRYGGRCSEFLTVCLVWHACHGYMSRSVCPIWKLRYQHIQTLWYSLYLQRKLNKLVSKLNHQCSWWTTVLKHTSWQMGKRTELAFLLVDIKIVCTIGYSLNLGGGPVLNNRHCQVSLCER